MRKRKKRKKRKRKKRKKNPAFVKKRERAKDTISVKNQNPFKRSALF